MAHAAPTRERRLLGMGTLACLTLMASVLLAGCGVNPTFGLITPRQMAIQQGNVLTQKQVEQIRVGMDPTEVRSLLGSPLLVDAFQPERWDYLYSFRSQEREVRRHLTLYFRADRLESIVGARTQYPER